jgi:SAM-dependent methyltransferase
VTEALAGRRSQLRRMVAEQVLWARVAGQRASARLTGSIRPLPARVPPCDVLRTFAQVQEAVQECRRLKLRPHQDLAKNWDALGAISTILHELGTDVRVLDAGAAWYSSILPWLRLYGARSLVGNNLEFGRVARHGPVRFEPGDITATGYDAGSFDAITCMSVIEHGVVLEKFAAESARLLRPGGLLVVSTDYDQQPPDTTGKFAYGTQVQIFGPEQIRAFVETAAGFGLTLLGELALEHEQRPVRWARMQLDYTFIRLAFARSVG